MLKLRKFGVFSPKDHLDCWERRVIKTQRASSRTQCVHKESASVAMPSTKSRNSVVSYYTETAGGCATFTALRILKTELK